MQLVEDELDVAGLTLRGTAMGGIQTCLMVPELGLMFDVGGRVRGMLKYGTVLVSHGHQDHLGGLHMLVSQRHLAGLPPLRVHVPREIHDPLTRIFAAWSEIEGFSLELDLIPHAPGECVRFRKDLSATCVRSIHRVPSLSWVVERRTARLKSEYRGVAAPELVRLRGEGVELTEDHVVPLLCVTGDTQIELLEREPAVRKAKVLVIEVTAWDERRSVEQTRGWGHIHVDELIAHAELFEGDALVLVHRSARHTRRQAEEVVANRFPACIRDRVHVFGR